MSLLASGGAVAATTTAAAAVTVDKVEEKFEESFEEDKKDNDISLIDDRPAVGSEYIEEEKDSSGTCSII